MLVTLRTKGLKKKPLYQRNLCVVLKVLHRVSYRQFRVIISLILNSPKLSLIHICFSCKSRFQVHLVFVANDNILSFLFVDRGFVKYSRSKVKYRSPRQRMKDWNEIYYNKGKSELKVQAARQGRQPKCFSLELPSQKTL